MKDSKPETADTKRRKHEIETPKKQDPASAAAIAVEQYARLYPDGFPPGHFLG